MQTPVNLLAHQPHALPPLLLSPLPLLLAGLSAIVSMLPSSEHVRQAYLGPQGILSVPAGQLHPHLLVDCSTIDPITSREVAAAAADTPLHPHAAEAHDGQASPMMIDAPVSGGVPGAQAGSLTFMVGGWVGGWVHAGGQAVPLLALLPLCAGSAHECTPATCCLRLQCGGPPGAVDAARPLLETMGKRVIYCEQAYPPAVSPQHSVCLPPSLQQQ
jgi:hypothetical protein